MELADIDQTARAIRQQITGVVKGQDRTIKLMLVALLCEGHILIEGVPGTGKTLLARTLSKSLDLEFGRIQFTPDLLPGDVLGTSLYNFETREFALTKGPIFTQFLLADEINRTPPKTQSALLEAMQESSVTIDGKTHQLDEGFFVVATQNPIEQEGTYPLPEAQLDRFLFKIDVTYPDRKQELEMVGLHGNRSSRVDFDRFEVAPICSLDFLRAARERVSQLHLSDAMLEYIVDIVRATREHPSLVCGASPRATNMLAGAVRAFAALSGREFATPDDVKFLINDTLRHRLVLAPGAEIDGSSQGTVLNEIIEKVPAPR